MKRFTQEEAKVIYNDAKNKGLDPDRVMAGLAVKGATFDGVDMNEALQFAKNKYGLEQSYGQDARTDIRQAGTGIKEAIQNRVGNIKESVGAFRAGEQGLKKTVMQGIGQAAGGVSDVFGETVMGAAKAALPQSAEESIAKGAEKVITPVVQSDAVQGLMERYNTLKETNPTAARDIDALLGLGSFAADFFTAGAAGQGAKAGLRAGKEVLETGASQVAKGATETAIKTKDTFFKVLSPKIDPGFKNIISKTKTEKFDDFVQTAERAANDVNAPSVYEKVAENMTNATQQIDNQVKSLNNQKKTIINKAKVGLNDFSKETGSTILEINKTLKDSKLGKQFIDRLKQVKTKLDADNAIDELQDILYKGNKDMTIPTGSAEDKALKSILGKYNSNLKEGLPKSYAKLNADIAERLSVLDILNRSLGETVDGVATRGAGLVKQFFSPAGTKTKQLFSYIKKTTGVDLAEDAVLAKYVGEAFGDTKIKSLLEGVPSSRSGVIDKALEFTLEKTGLQDAFSEAKQKGMLEKARNLTK